MNVLVLSYLYPNAEFPDHAIFVHNRVRAQSRLERVTVINPIPWSPVYRFFRHHRRFSSIPQIEVIDGINVYHPRFLSIPKLAKQVEVHTYRRAVQNVLSGDLRGQGFDLVDLHWTFPDLPTGATVAEQLGAKLVTTIRGAEALHLGEGSFAERCVQRHLGYTDALIGVSTHLTELASRHAHRATLKTTVRNGVNTQTFTYRDRAACRDELGLPQDRRIILSVGSLIHGKGFDLIISALSRLRREDDLDTTQLHICGSVGHAGDDFKSLHALVQELGLQDSVVFVGQVKNRDLVTWYNAADVFCLASRGEGSPNVLAEALACGCPSVSTDVGAAREILDSEPNQGVCVAPNDALELEQGLKTVLRAQHDRVSASKSFEAYSWDWCAEQVVGIHRALVQREPMVVPVGP